MGSIFFAMFASAFALASCAAVGGCCCLDLCDADAGAVAASPRGVARPPPASDFDWHHKQSPR